MQKLNFGCGSIQPEDWVNVDKDPMFAVKQRNVETLESDKFDIAVAHCSLQMVEFHDMHALLTELHRVLKPGGVLRISLPDILAGFQNYIHDVKEFFPNSEDDLSVRFTAWLTWYSTSKTLFTVAALRKFLEDAGFKDVKRVDYKETGSGISEIIDLDTREGECFFVEARK